MSGFLHGALDAASETYCIISDYPGRHVTNKKSCHDLLSLQDHGLHGRAREEGGLDPDPDRKNTEIVDDAGVAVLRLSSTLRVSTCHLQGFKHSVHSAAKYVFYQRSRLACTSLCLVALHNGVKCESTCTCCPHITISTLQAGGGRSLQIWR